MKKLVLCAAFGLLAASAAAQGAVKVTYAAPAPGGRGIGNMPALRTVLTIDGEQCRIGRELDTLQLLREHPEWASYLEEMKQRYRVRETQYIDYAAMKYYGAAELADGELIATEESFALEAPGLEIAPSDSVICGYRCKVATTVINSNTINYWFTDEAGVEGTVQPAANLPRGLVLMTARNGRVGLRAVSVEKTRAERPLIPSFPTLVDAAMYRYRINNAGVITVPIFDGEYVGLRESDAPATVDELQADVVYRVSGGTILLKKVKLPESSEGWDIFAQVVQQAEKDAYDRTGSVFVIPTGKERSFLEALVGGGLKSLPAFDAHNGKSYPAIVSTADYDTPVELMRFFTPFGVHGYNHIRVPGQTWADAITYHQDVTHLAPMLQGEVWIGAYIGNWVDKGHKLTLTLKYHPGGGEQGRRVVVPVFNSVNLMEQGGQDYPDFMAADSLRATVEIARPIRGAQLVYLTTGHGGWGGGDEFNQKLNTIFLDGERIFTVIPWREDCSSYRYRNPASGNFNNGLSSSDLSRSNWCPGTVTNPIYVPLGDLPAGRHTFAVTIPQGAPEGSSFSYWCLSGAIVGEEVDALPADAAGVEALGSAGSVGSAASAAKPAAAKSADKKAAAERRAAKKRSRR